ncbi:hypothetical protein EDB89DRAFT_1849101 [Lactarius sanguifluus]|nr:hypothetical protein EDB89DRAFT_1849101 [Lactarius sanguifluus]
MSTIATPSPSTSLPHFLGKFSLPPHADIILRSSDSHDFLVQKLYVVDSSPVLGEQITAATCHGIGPEATSEATTVDGENKSEPFLPVVHLDENHAILSSLLTFVFPVPPVLPPTLEQILELLSVAKKYEMITALVRIRDCASRRDPPLIRRHTALRVYSLAWKYGLLKETLEAAEATLKYPMTIQDFEYELDIMPGVALYELWKYRQRVLENLAVSLSAEYFDSEVYFILCGADLDCVERSEYADYNPDIPLWLDQYLDSVLEDPACVNLTTFHLALSSHVSPMGECCEECPSIPRKIICDFWDALTSVVRECARKVSLLSRV